METIKQLILEAMKNQMAQAGLLTVLFSGIMYKIQPTIMFWIEFVRQRITSTVQYYENAPNYEAFLKLIKPYIKSRHYNNLGDLSTGTYYLFLNNRPTILSSRLITLNDRMVYTIYVESFFCKNLSEWVKKQIEEKTENTIDISAKTQWNTYTKLIKRDNVKLPTKNAKKLFKLIENFQKSDLTKLGVMLYGPPGNGKTQAVLNIAKKLKLNIQILPLTPLTQVQDLYACSLSSDKNTIILLEDLDRLPITNDENSNEKYNISKGDLLNFLDGVMTDNTLIIATANNYEKLDPALMRTGRFDVHFLFENPEVEDIENIYESELGKCPISFSKENVGKNVADIYKIIREEQIKKLYA